MKRGQAEIWQIDTLFQLIIGMLVASAMFYAVYNLNYSDDFSKQLIKEDIGLILETLKTVPDDVKIEYPLTKGDFEVIIIDGDVTVTGDKNLLDNILRNKRFLIIEKKGNEIFLNGAKI